MANCNELYMVLWNMSISSVGMLRTLFGIELVLFLTSFDLPCTLLLLFVRTRPPYFSARMLLFKDCKDVVEGWKAGGFVFLLSCKSICLTDCMNLLNFSGSIQCTGWGSGDAFMMEPICHYPWDRWHCWDTSQQHVCFALNQTVWKFLISRLTSCSADDTLVWPSYLYRSSWEELEFSVPSCMWLEVGDYCVLGMVSVDMSSNRVTTTTMSVQDMETMEV